MKAFLAKNSMIEKIVDYISKQTSKNWFLFFCVILPFIGLIFSQTMALVGFISSSFLQLALLPIITRAQDKQTNKTDILLETQNTILKQQNTILTILQKEEEEVLADVVELKDAFSNENILRALRESTEDQNKLLKGE